MGLDELEPSVAVVGSRSATSYGTTIAGEIAAVVARAGYPVVSGAAFGIDQAAHRGALAAGGRTVAVLACGVDLVYPPAHHQLLEHLGEDLRRGLRAATGAVRVAHPLPEPQPPDRRPHPRHRRGRGGGPQRGAQHRRLGSPSIPAADVGARPGDGRPVRGHPRAAPQGRRQHRHPRRGGPRAGRPRAATTSSRPAAGGSYARDRLPPRQQQVLDAVPRHRGVGADAIARTAGIGLLDTQAALQRLERAGIVARTSDGWRIRDVNAPDSPAENAEVPTMNP